MATRAEQQKPRQAFLNKVSFVIKTFQNSKKQGFLEEKENWSIGRKRVYKNKICIKSGDK